MRIRGTDERSARSKLSEVIVSRAPTNFKKNTGDTWRMLVLCCWKKPELKQALDLVEAVGFEVYRENQGSWFTWRKFSSYAQQEFHLMTAPHFLLLLVAEITINAQTKISRIPLPYLGDVMIPFVQSLILIVADAWVFPFRRTSRMSKWG